MKYTGNNAEEFLKWAQGFSSKTMAAEMAGVPRTTFLGWYARAETELEKTKSILSHSENLSVVPLTGDDDIPVEEIVEMMSRRFEKRKQYHDKANWRTIRMKSDAPIGLAWLGDPHIDDNGCDWPTLRRDLDIIKDTKGMYGCSLGDHTNNWVGRLARLYANQDTSQDTAIKLVKWFFEYINWLIIINGNHDMWLQQGDPMKWLAKSHQINSDWKVNVQIEFPNEATFKCVASHDFSGHSQWNPLHANMKVAKFGDGAHLYIAGHRHNWALTQVELAEKDQTVWLARARGYKFMDDYALTRGYGEQKYGQAVACIINPKSNSETGFVQCFADLEEASDYLCFLRKKYGA